MDQNNLQNDTFKLFAQTWQTMLNEQVRQVELGYAQLNAAQSQLREQNTQVADEMTRLARSQMDYMLKLQDEWRGLVSEAVRTNMEMLSPKK
ncbi:MAG: hypothetical protein RBU37_05570 [Myxococcota bacterium]|jgi:hypothetical protein|nr:hypothetical protein [Myxococcota bacterium]